ncbi:DUF6404 family protein [Klebsiella pneumoniae]|uniref:DUF6404 family protein n=1 Tax=Klebsiella pneumoniae TaxID=573 RepID=UPI000F5380EB|nr:DUF6404 family protein [Klebsiella pneumoniae]
MASCKMWKSNYAPLLIRLLWRLGINIPRCRLLRSGRFWRDGRLFLRRIRTVDVLDVAGPGMPPLFACKISLIAGVLFGLTMALFHLWRRKVNKLPDWKDL